MLYYNAKMHQNRFVHDKLLLKKIMKFVATKWRILQLKCTQFDFGWGSAPDPARGAYSAPPDPLAGFRGLTSKGGKGEERRGGAKPSPLTFF